MVERSQGWGGMKAGFVACFLCVLASVTAGGAFAGPAGGKGLLPQRVIRYYEKYTGPGSDKYFTLKREPGVQETRLPPYIIERKLGHDAENVDLHGSGQIGGHLKDGKPYFAVTGRSNHILLSNLNPRKPGSGEGSWTLLEDGVFGRAGIPYPGMVAVFKRGELDDAAMWKAERAGR